MHTCIIIISVVKSALIVIQFVISSESPANWHLPQTRPHQGKVRSSEVAQVGQEYNWEKRVYTCSVIKFMHVCVIL